MPFTQPTQQSSAEQNKAVVKRFLEGIVNGGDYGLVHDLFASDYVLHLPGQKDPLRGPDAVVGMARMFRSAFPDWRNAVDQLVIVAEGDRVLTRWKEAGTHRGDFQGIPPSGRRVTLEGMDMFRLQGGKIVEHWVEADMASFRRSLGSGEVPPQEDPRGRSEPPEPD